MPLQRGRSKHYSYNWHKIIHAKIIENFLLSEPVNARGLVLAQIITNSVRHKIAFTAISSSLNNVKWVCNDFETRPGAIDRLTQWKGSHCFDRVLTAFHRWVCVMSSCVSGFIITGDCHSVVAFVYLSEFEVFLFWTWFNRKKKMSFCSLSRCLFFNIASRLHPGFLPQSKNKHVLKWPVQGVPPSLAQQKALQGSNPPIGVYRMQWLSSRTVIGTKI